MPASRIIAERLRQEIAGKELTAAELAKRAGVKNSFIYDILSGKSANPSTVKLARVADALGVSLAWLVGGDKRAASGMDDERAESVSIPRILVEASAGGGSVVMQEAEGEDYYFRRSWIRDRLGTTPQDLRILYLRGDSMEPTLYHNDLILIDTTKTSPSPPGIFVLFDGFGLVAKRLEYVANSEPPAIRVLSDNLQYSSYERILDEVRIIGRVVWFAREM